MRQIVRKLAFLPASLDAAFLEKKSCSERTTKNGRFPVLCNCKELHQLHCIRRTRITWMGLLCSFNYDNFLSFFLLYTDLPHIKLFDVFHIHPHLYRVLTFPDNGLDIFTALRGRIFCRFSCRIRSSLRRQDMLVIPLTIQQLQQYNPYFGFLVDWVFVYFYK